MVVLKQIFLWAPTKNPAGTQLNVSRTQKLLLRQNRLAACKIFFTPLVRLRFRRKIGVISRLSSIRNNSKENETSIANIEYGVGGTAAELGYSLNKFGDFLGKQGCELGIIS